MRRFKYEQVVQEIRSYYYIVEIEDDVFNEQLKEYDGNIEEILNEAVFENIPAKVIEESREVHDTETLWNEDSWEEIK